MELQPGADDPPPPTCLHVPGQKTRAGIRSPESSAMDSMDTCFVTKESLHDLSVLFLLLLGLGRRGLVLLGVRHGDHGEDEVDEVERAEEDHDHEEDHVGLTSCSQRLQSDSRVRDRQTHVPLWTDPGQITTKITFIIIIKIIITIIMNHHHPHHQH
ncbi:hypothetical protein EYF80_059338 [Liparis tanakae]|uniref:Uncharacterized protein n=1 Tax=Liparis tanakae TaxID=230148 RepID=A0A4Z2EPN7_9TELE|nr:hypothetical protein EYF80_059338 [Liparis tanakae]